ncbi:MAG: long-chain acyl-CoA synthetase [Paracoccaceae bacterium]|jgi:long-chain acyl-CoA synthetase
MTPTETNLGFFNAQAAAAHGARTAIIDLSRPMPFSITHAELDDRMNRVAAALQARGLARGDRLLLATGNRFEFIEVFFGAMRAGIVPIPLNHKLGADTIRFVIADADARGAVISPECHPEIEALVDEAGLTPKISTGTDAPDWEAYEDVLAAADPGAIVSPDIAPREVAFLPYTSGSTGVPKGVLLPHDGMLWAIRAAQHYWPLVPDDRALIAGPLFHKNAMRVSVKPMLRIGASVVILPQFEPKMFLGALADYDCTHSGGVPAMYRMALAEEDLLASLTFPKLKCLEMGSAVVGADLIAAVETAFDTPVIEAYGLTEGGGPLREPPQNEGAPSHGPVPRGSCGIIAPEVEVKLIDADGAENPSEGELWVRSPAVLTGYNNRPELTAERIVDGFLRTGDIFRCDEDGHFFFMGRTDDQFSCGGENINPKEVELLLVQHPDVVDAVVAPIPHDVKGLAPAALITVRGTPAPDEDAVKQFTLDHGPAYAHPRRVFVVDQMPFNGAGKIDRALAKAEMLSRIAASD